MVARPVRYPAGETTVKLFYRNPVLSPSGASRFTKTYFDARASPRTADPQVFPVTLAQSFPATHAIAH